MSDEIYTCLVCGKQLKKYVNPLHLRTHGMTCDDYRKLDPTAKFTLATGWNKGLTKETNASMAKASASHKTPEYRERFESAMQEKYGVSYAAQDPEMLKRILHGTRRTNLERYGVENYTQSVQAKPVLSRNGSKAIKRTRRIFEETGYKYKSRYEIMFHEMFPKYRCNEKIMTGVRPGIKGQAAWYAPDFIDDETKTIYEIDGSFHDPEHDRIRDDFLRSLGYTIVRYSNEQVSDMYTQWKSQEQDIV